MAVSVGLEELHDELARRGHPSFRPAHGYALLAILDGLDTASAIAPRLGVTKQGAAKLLQWLLDEKYVAHTAVEGGDARRRPVVLTDRGRDVIRLSGEVQAALEERWARAVGERRMATARRVLEEALGERTVVTRPPW
jgi:DNA-binding MarR family transcriptional regulator